MEVSRGSVVLRDVEIRGPRDGDSPLVAIDRIVVSTGTGLDVKVTGTGEE